MTSITVSFEDDISTTLTKTNSGILMDGVEIPIDMNEHLNAQWTQFLQQSIQRGNNPQFARFQTIWARFFFEQMLTDFIDTLYNEHDDHTEIFERIVYELWKDGSRIQDTDIFILNPQGVQCQTLGSAADLQNIEVMIDTLLALRN